jgi:hypothetical protein
MLQSLALTVYIYIGILFFINTKEQYSEDGTILVASTGEIQHFEALFFKERIGPTSFPFVTYEY